MMDGDKILNGTTKLINKIKPSLKKFGIYFLIVTCIILCILVFQMATQIHLTIPTIIDIETYKTAYTIETGEILVVDRKTNTTMFVLTPQIVEIIHSEKQYQNEKQYNKEIEQSIGNKRLKK